jgi:hypothetical protein
MSLPYSVEGIHLTWEGLNCQNRKTKRNKARQAAFETQNKFCLSLKYDTDLLKAYINCKNNGFHYDIFIPVYYVL